MEIIYIYLFILTIIVIYILYKIRNIEPFTASSDINTVINDKYKVDMDAMRNLAQISKEIMVNKDTLTLPTNITIPGDLTVKGNVNFENRIDKLLNIIPSGFIMAHFASYDPKGWAICDGQYYILDPNGNAVAVFSTAPGAILTPDLRSRFIIGSSGTAENQTITNNGAQLKSRPYGGWGGEENVTITEGQIPSHNHLMFSEATAYSSESLTIDKYVASKSMNGVFGGTLYEMRPPQSLMGQLDPARAAASIGKTSSVGSSMPHNNMPPYFSLKYYMKL
jgi:microcystin-dependent protein